MNIKIPDSWLRDYIKTKATPEQIAKALSLHAFSVERMEQWDDGDTIYEIEITPNRGDALSVQGIAREINASLPRLGVECSFVETRSSPKGSLQRVSTTLPLAVQIDNESLVPRFSAIILDNIKITQSPALIRTRLEKVGIRSIDNVVDVTNYFMIDKGQPMHSFDYDKILGNKMIVRESEAGESIVTLDGQKRKLPSGVIVIEDGKGRLIDLCGIMGAQNSEVDGKTKRVLLFVQIYDPVLIRQASMSLGHRTDAAVRFEKGIDPLGVVPSLWEAVEMLKQNADAQIASELIDIENETYKEKVVPLDIQKINQISGVEISEKEALDSLRSLGFLTKQSNSQVIVPSWRSNDIEIPEDLAEEVIRLYGYYNLPNEPLTGAIPQEKKEKSFHIENKAKVYLKHQGFFESYNTSATSKELAGETSLPLANPLSKELAYLRTSLIPQLVEVVKQNKGYGEKIKLFELANVYLPQGENELPEQPLRLGIVTKGVSYAEHKGIIEGLIKELDVETRCSEPLGELRVSKPETPRSGVPALQGVSTNEGILATEIDFKQIVKHAGKTKTFTPISKFAPVKQDLTLVVPQGVSYYEIEQIIKNASEHAEKVEYIGTYENTITVSVELLDKESQVNSSDAAEIRKEILNMLKEKLNVELK